MSKCISVLGSTGSVGRQTLQVAQELDLQVAALTAGRQIDLLEQQARQFRPCLAAVFEENAARELYLSWADAVKLAMERYEIVIDRYQSGGFPARREPVDNLLSANGSLMEELANLQLLREELRLRRREKYSLPELKEKLQMHIHEHFER